MDLRKSRLWQDSLATPIVYEGDVNECVKWLGWAKVKLQFMLKSGPGARSETFKPVEGVEIRVDSRPNRIRITSGESFEYISIMDFWTDGTTSTYPDAFLPPYQIKDARLFFGSTQKQYRNPKAYYGAGTRYDGDSGKGYWTNGNSYSLSWVWFGIHINGKFVNLRNTIINLLTSKGWYDARIMNGIVLAPYGNHNAEAVAVIILEWWKTGNYPNGTQTRGQYLLRLDLSNLATDSATASFIIHQDATDSTILASDHAAIIGQSFTDSGYYSQTRFTKSSRSVAWFTSTADGEQTVILRVYDSTFSSFVDTVLLTQQANGYTTGSSWSKLPGEPLIVSIQTEENAFGLLRCSIDSASGSGSESHQTISPYKHELDYSYSIGYSYSLATLSAAGELVETLTGLGDGVSASTFSGSTQSQSGPYIEGHETITKDYACIPIFRADKAIAVVAMESTHSDLTITDVGPGSSKSLTTDYAVLDSVDYMVDKTPTSTKLHESSNSDSFSGSASGTELSQLEKRIQRGLFSDAEWYSVPDVAQTLLAQGFKGASTKKTLLVARIGIYTDVIDIATPATYLQTEYIFSDAPTLIDTQNHVVVTHTYQRIGTAESIV